MAMIASETSRAEGSRRPGLRNWYTDPALGAAQEFLAAEAATALARHEAVWVWDLGNENSNCVIPPTKASARAWLARLTSAIRGADETALVTVGLHMEDLEEDRQLGPSEASDVCDLLCVHGYPIYARWADGATDDLLLPFLENSAAAYTATALEELRRAVCLGAMLWCYSDYDPALWESPPLDLAAHERTFGMWRVDGSPKPSVAAVAEFVGAECCVVGDADAWIDIEPSEFFRDPSAQLPRLYRRYRSSRVVDAGSPA